MKRNRIVVLALVAGLVGLALPVFAAGGEKAVQPSAELGQFFKDRGVDPRYLGKSRAEVPADQWKKINEIVATPNVESDDTAALDYGDDHDVLNSLVFDDLYAASNTIGETVYLTLGNTTWRHELTLPPE